MDTILVLCQSRRQSALIARTLRYRQVYSLPLALDSRAETVLSYAPKGIVLSANDGMDNALAQVDPALLSAGVPVLALGGMVPALCRFYGGEASPSACPRGAVTLGLEHDPLFTNISGGERVLRSLSDLTLPESLLPLATATERPIGFRHRTLPLYAVQYPIERNDPDAAQLLFNFASFICGAAASWDEDAMIQLAVERIREAAPEGRVLCAVSGGVDSAVCARLASLAVGDRLMCVFVDTGLFRQGEPESVISTFMDAMGLVVAHVDASEAFLRALSGVRSRDDKERIAAQLMTQVLIKQLGYDPGIRAIVLGANLNDALFGFSTSAEMESVKSAYNLCVCEPVRDLFKEEVRRLATALSLPDSIALRQPFPASGLALRIFGQVTPERAGRAAGRRRLFQRGDPRGRLCQTPVAILHQSGGQPGPAGHLCGEPACAAGVAGRGHGGPSGLRRAGARLGAHPQRGQGRGSRGVRPYAQQSLRRDGVSRGTPVPSGKERPLCWFAIPMPIRSMPSLRRTVPPEGRWM